MKLIATHASRRSPAWLHQTLAQLSFVAAGVILFASAVAFAQEPAALDALEPARLLGVILDAVEHRAWGTVAAAVLVLLVAALRAFGRRLHDAIPDESPLDKPFFWLLETRPGGWTLNFLTALAGGFGTALLAGQPITWELARAVTTVALSGAGLWALVKDVLEARKPPATEPESGGGAS